MCAAQLRPVLRAAKAACVRVYVRARCAICQLTIIIPRAHKYTTIYIMLPLYAYARPYAVRVCIIQHKSSQFQIWECCATLCTMLASNRDPWPNEFVLSPTCTGAMEFYRAVGNFPNIPGSFPGMSFMFVCVYVYSCGW